MNARSGRPCRLSRLTLLAALLLIAAPASAYATDVHVETTGVNSPTCGPSIDPCLTIAQATTNAVSGDRVVIGNGTFIQTATINPGAKSIQYVGNGPGNTTISGGDSTSFATPGGLIRFQTSGTNVAVRDLRIIDLPATTPSATRFGIWVQALPTNPASTINATIDNVVIQGSGAAGISEIGVQAGNNNGSLTITDSTLTDLMGNSILFENQRGAVSVSGNTFSKPFTSTSPLIFDMLHALGVNNYDQTGLHSFSSNSFSTPSAITLVGGWLYGTTPGPSAFPVGVEIIGNAMHGSGINSNAIALINAANTTSGLEGRINNVVIRGNSITDGGNGIVMQGLILGALIERNYIHGRTAGIVATRRTQTFSPFTTFDHLPAGVDVQLNQITGNGSGITSDPVVPVTIDAENNWWGCNGGPGATGCNTISQPTDTVDADPWAVLTISSDRPTLPADDTSVVTAGITTNSDGDGALILPDGTLLPFSATFGTLSPPAAATTDSAAQTTFVSNASTGRSVSVTYDNQTATVTWPDVDSPPIPPPTPPIDDLLPQCARDLLITNVAVRGSRSLIQGVARPKFAGQRVRINFMPSGSRVIARPLVGSDGRFSVTVRRPSRPATGSNRARYRALLGGHATRWIKLTRRLNTSNVSFANGRVTVRGRITQPIAPGRRVQVTRSDVCGRYRRVGSVAVRRDGTFNASAATTPNPAVPAVFVRLNVRVRRGGSGRNRNRQFTTYSIVQPVLMR